MKIENSKIENYVLTVGLEIHAELNTRTKMFCDSKNDPDETRPNVNICPVCMGHPGTLPTINKEAVKSVLRLGVAVGGELADYTEFDRKNYFYPDIPKGYQISQYKHPLVRGGQLAGVELTRIHLEEDTAKSLHSEQGESLLDLGVLDLGESLLDLSLLDFNRAGVPLMELVTEPVIKSAFEAAKFAKELQLLLTYLGIAEANMEKGELRVEANISVAPRSPNDADSTQKVAEDDFLYKDLTYKIRGILFDIRKKLGLGHKEQIYHNALEIELKNAGLSFESKKNLSVSYGDKKIGIYQPDFIIEDKVIIELKALPKIAKQQEEQLWSYLKGCDYKLALLVNFGSGDLEIRRVVYDSARSASGLRESAVPLGTKVEVKNLNSFRSVERAIRYEFDRQVSLLETGEQVVQETRGWDENKLETYSQRVKEDSHDYRYFPDPDLPKIFIKEVSEFSEKELKKSLPELPAQKRERLSKLGISKEHVEIYVTELEKGRLFEETLDQLGSWTSKLAILVSNYITSDLKKLISPEALAELIKMISSEEISSRGAKEILKIIQEEGSEPKVIAEENNLMQISDREALKKLADEVMKENDTDQIQFLVGQAMKKSGGRANPVILQELFLQMLDR